MPLPLDARSILTAVKNGVDPADPEVADKVRVMAEILVHLSTSRTEHSHGSAGVTPHQPPIDRLKSMRLCVTKAGSPAVPRMGPKVHEGKPCKPGWSAARTGCTPKKKPGKTGERDTGTTPEGKKGKPTVEGMYTEIQGLLANPSALHAGSATALAEKLQTLTVANLNDLKKRLGVKGSGKKKILAGKIAERALENARSRKTEQASRGLEDVLGNLAGVDLSDPESVRAALQRAGWSRGGATREMEKPGEGVGDASDATRGAEETGERPGVAAERGGGEGAGGAPDETGGGVAEETGGPAGEAATERRVHDTEPVGKTTARRVPANQQEIDRRLDRFEKFFRGKGQHHIADWMSLLKEHISEVGGEAALVSLGEDLGTSSGKVQYAGVDTEESPNWASMGHFIESYLNRSGITPLTGQAADHGSSIISSQTNKEPWGGSDFIRENDFSPAETPYNDKLEEAKDLPGLEASEDVSKIMGKPVTHVTPEVMSAMDEHYGKGKWLIKTYSPDNAFAGFGIFFPQRLAQISQDARNMIWTAGTHLAGYGFELHRDENNKVAGLKHHNGDVYQFGTPKYNDTIQGDARHWADQAAVAADNEKGAMLPNDGKEFMTQPAFPVVGVSEAERAAGKTIVSGEGRVHVRVKDGKASVIPHSTWLKGEHLPVVFENDDTRAMARAAQEAINALPEKARKGQVYAPDIVKTADGYRVVELNASVEHGGSGYLSDNPFIIDSYVSHITGRSPAHVQFIRNLLMTREKREKALAATRARHRVRIKRGGSCKPGQTSARTGCTPASGDAGPGKGLPGATDLDMAVSEAARTPEGKAAVRKGVAVARSLGSRIRQTLGKVASRLIAAADLESRGGASLILGCVSGAGLMGCVTGSELLFSSVFNYIHQEVFEAALSEHSIPGAAVAGKIAATALATAESKAMAGVAWAMGKLMSRPGGGEATHKNMSARKAHTGHSRSQERGRDLILSVLSGVVMDNLGAVYRECGVEDVALPDEEAVRNRLAVSLGWNGGGTSPEVTHPRISEVLPQNTRSSPVNRLKAKSNRTW